MNKFMINPGRVRHINLEEFVDRFLRENVKLC